MVSFTGITHVAFFFLLLLSNSKSKENSVNLYKIQALTAIIGYYLFIHCFFVRVCVCVIVVDVFFF